MDQNQLKLHSPVMAQTQSPVLAQTQSPILTQEQVASSTQSQYSKLGYIGIRKEDKSKWERRAPLTPNQVKELLEKHSNLKFFVEPSNSRVFKDIEYKKAGAIITSDLSECSLILGVKEVPIHSLIPNKTYIFFSHVIKAQEQNMHMLDKILEKNIRLIDYEKITDENGNRLVAFGKFAGNAGAIDFLVGIGKFFLNKGYSTPLLNISMAYSYYNLQKAKEAISIMKGMIENDGIPNEFCPMIFAITSKGRVSSGVLEILNCLPIKIVDPDELALLVENKEDPAHKSVIYVTFIETQHMVAPIDPKVPFNKQDYYSHPDKYKPIFHEKYLPYISCIFHCMYWDPKFQRLITIDQMKKLTLENRSRLFGISDITCDLEGSIEFLKKFTSIDHPFYIYIPETEDVIDDIHLANTGILYHAVDHLPTELAWDSTNHFGNQLSQFVERIAMSDITKPIDEQNLAPEILRAMITWNGKLTPAFEYIIRLRVAKEEMRKKHAYNVRGPSKMTRELSFLSLKLEGHLFDTMAINKIFEELEKLDIEFRILDLEIGKRTNRKTYAYLQIFGKNKKAFNEALETMFEIAKQYDISIMD